MKKYFRIIFLSTEKTYLEAEAMKVRPFSRVCKEYDSMICLKNILKILLHFVFNKPSVL